MNPDSPLPGAEAAPTEEPRPSRTPAPGAPDDPEPRTDATEDPDLPEDTTFVLTFLPDDDGATTPEEVAELLRQRSVVAVVAAGADLGTPGAAVAVVATDATGRVLLDAAGRLVPGQQVEHLVPGLAHLTGRSVLVDDEVVVGPDGSESEPEESSLAARTARSLVLWRASTGSPGYVRGIAHGVGAAVEHAIVDGWTVVALPPGRTLDAEALAAEVLSGGERPVVSLVRAGHARAVTWHHRERGRAVTVELASAPLTTPVVREGGPGSEAALLAARLGDAALRVVPDTGRLPAETLARLRSLPLERTTLLVDAADALGLPPGLAERVERAGGHALDDPDAAPGRWLDVPGADLLAPDPSLGSAVARGLLDSVLTEPQGAGAYARFRRWLWHRPVVLVLLSLLEVGVGVAFGAWALAGGTLFGHAWPVWVAAALWLLDGVPDAAAGVVLVRRRRRARASASGRA